MTLSLAMQRQCVEHALAVAEFEKTERIGSGTQEGLRQAAITLAWLERRAELMKALDRLERERPDLVDLFKEFPSAQIADVQPMPGYDPYKEAFFNGSGAE